MKENKDTQVRESLESLSAHFYNKKLNECTNEEVFPLLVFMIKDINDYNKNNSKTIKEDKNKKTIYYFSAEFLEGKLLSNNLINLGIYNSVKNVLESTGHEIGEVEEIENEPSLGNGGLGRLAACFLDSISTLEIEGEGIGLNYHLGLFKQEFGKNPNNMNTYLKQTAVPDTWINKDSWLNRMEDTYNVKLCNKDINVVRYTMDVTGYDNGNVIPLNLFDLDTIDESIVKNGIDYDNTDIEKCLTLSLYPNDSTENGKKLRICQQYVMVSAGAQYIINKLKKDGIDLRDMAKHVAIQINDTHPSMVIPELLRLLTDEGISFDEAVEIITNTCGYTNHTILAEALEKWNISYLEETVPHLLPYIYKLNDKVNEKYRDDKVAIVKDGKVHMAHMDIHFSHSTNGVAYLHSEILKNSELNHFYKLYPNKFNNKTNGITFRRWLIECNPRLTSFICELIGDSWKKDASKLKELEKFTNDESVLNRLIEIKGENKVDFANYLAKKENVSIDPNSIYDVQSKRLHMYKRQSLNFEYILLVYDMIKKGELRPKTPITFIFGAKAAESYYDAKAQINNLLILQKRIEEEPEVSKYMKVVMLENYNVTYAEKLIPAADISEQISLASQEASGTGNMKFMLNGALTLGTLDGANVEIKNLVGDDNIYIFGMDSDEVLNYSTNMDPEEKWHRLNYDPHNLYNPKNGYTNPKYRNSYLLKRLWESQDILAKETKHLREDNSNENYFWGLRGILRDCDYYMNSLDLIGHDAMQKTILIPNNNGGYDEKVINLNKVDGYYDVKNKMINEYNDNQINWARKALLNIANAGFFSSDRTINEYNDEIWKASQKGKVYTKKHI